MGSSIWNCMGGKQGWDGDAYFRRPLLAFFYTSLWRYNCHRSDVIIVIVATVTIFWSKLSFTCDIGGTYTLWSSSSSKSLSFRFFKQASHPITWRRAVNFHQLIVVGRLRNCTQGPKFSFTWTRGPLSIVSCHKFPLKAFYKILKIWIFTCPYGKFFYHFWNVPCESKLSFIWTKGPLSIVSCHEIPAQSIFQNIWIVTCHKFRFWGPVLRDPCPHEKGQNF